jgi:hypothetical protein
VSMDYGRKEYRISRLALSHSAGESERLSDRFVGDLPAMDVQRIADRFRIADRSVDSGLRDLNDPGECDIA